MKTLSLIRLTVAGSVLCASTNSFGVIAYQDNFDAGTSGSAWTAVQSQTNSFANFAYDYSTLGIPSAPNSTSGTTIGMNFLANQFASTQQGISASPNGQSFTGDFTIRFDMWLNYNGPVGVPGGLPGGSGSTQVGSFGWGTSGASAQWAGGSASMMFGATGDGGSGSDYRLYRNNALVVAGPAYAAGSLNNTAAYYTGLFGGQAAPAAQIGLFPGQTGVTDPGTLGFKWRDVVIEKIDTILTWTVDGNLIATGDSAGATLSGDNIFFGTFDINNSSSTDVNDHLITAIYDNIVVTVPEPSTAVMIGLGLTVLVGFARNRKI